MEPVDGIDIMLERRKKDKLTPALTAGPGALSEALAIYTKDTGLDLSEKSSLLYIEDRGIKIPQNQIIADTRVGVAYAKEDAYLPYRFYIKDNKYVSKGKGLKLPA